MARRYLESSALHIRIREVSVRDRRILAGAAGPREEERLGQFLPDRQFSVAVRHGKRIFLKLVQGGQKERLDGKRGGRQGELWLTLHLGLTGRLLCLDQTESEPRHTRLLISFQGGSRLAFDDPRIFGEVGLTGSPQAFLKERRIGPDALQMDEETFKGIMSGRKGLIKPALLNQSLVAGLGNLYADEALFQAGILPTARRLDEPQLSRLFICIQEVLRASLSVNSDLDKLPDSYLLPRRRPGDSCPRDGALLKREKIGDRTSYFCPAHQR